MIIKGPTVTKTAPTRPRRRRRLELGKTLFLLPNMITISSIFCGFDAIRLAARGGEDDIYRAAGYLKKPCAAFDLLTIVDNTIRHPA